MLLLALAAAVGGFFWARAALTNGRVETALEEQLSRALGEPVSIGTLSLGFTPRVTLTLGAVTIGQPPQTTVDSLQLRTNLWPLLLSRRAEHVYVRLAGARVELPLLAAAVGRLQGAGSARVGGQAPIEIASIDAVELRDVDMLSGGRTVHGDMDIVPRGGGFEIRNATLRAADAVFHIQGSIDDVSGPRGDLTITSDDLNLDALLGVTGEFARRAGLPGAPRAGSGPAGSGLNLGLALNAKTAALGGLQLERLDAKGRLTSAGVALDPVAFRLFGGAYSGELGFTTASSPGFRTAATLSGIDMAAVMTFVGHPGQITGRASGRIDISGSGTDADSVLRTARGSARMQVADGIVRNLGLVRGIVIATSGRSDAGEPAGGSAPDARPSRDEPFSRISANWSVAGGTARTEDLQLESRDLLLSAAGTIALDGSAIDLAGRVQLSDALAKQAGRDLVRYTQVDGRPTLPVTITGSLDDPTVSVDVGTLLQRAITNRAGEEVKGAIQRGLGQILKK